MKIIWCPSIDDFTHNVKYKTKEETDEQTNLQTQTIDWWLSEGNGD